MYFYIYEQEVALTFRVLMGRGRGNLFFYSYFTPHYPTLCKNSALMLYTTFSRMFKDFVYFWAFYMTCLNTSM